MNRLFTVLFWVSIVVSLLTAIWFVLHGTLYFHTDIARDFLLIEDIVVNKKLTLIGPHSGGIDGVFHGPAWLYLNVPAFILGRGNPIVVGWFWVLLVLLSLGIVYACTKKLSDTKTAMIATALYGLIISDSAANLFNPFGAVLLVPLFFYFFIRYMQKQKYTYLIMCLFFIGLIIQFQMAWGVPVLILSLPLLLYKIITKKKFLHIVSFLVLFIPLSTYILFDLRHQFLQMKSVLIYLSHSSTQLHTNIIFFIGGRLQDMFLSLLNMLALGNSSLQLFFFLSFIFFIYYVKNRKIHLSPYLLYFLYFYVGYWILTLFYKGTMWGYYTTPFIPLFCMTIAFLFKYIPKKLKTILFVVIIIPLLFINVRNLFIRNDFYFKNSTDLWRSYSQQAKTIYDDAKGDFGWYVYSADQYGYSPKYAMHFIQRSNQNKKGFSFEKKSTTYLIITPSSNKYTNATDWKKDKIYVTRKPDKVFTFQGSYVEKYRLSEEEQRVPSANDLIRDLIFR